MASCGKGDRAALSLRTSVLTTKLRPRSAPLCTTLRARLGQGRNRKYLPERQQRANRLSRDKLSLLRVLLQAVGKEALLIAGQKDDFRIPAVEAKKIRSRARLAYLDRAR
jgi:hypothetical protein